MRSVALIPAFEAATSVGQVVSELLAIWPDQGACPRVLVVNDGSTDGTAEVAQRAGALVLSLAKNSGKGAALRAGLQRAAELGAELVVTLDADGQHPPAEAVRLLHCDADPTALVLGIRSLAAAGAPQLNRFSNGFSNLFVSWFAGRPLRDTQCGLRRYPVRATLLLAARSDGFGFESELLVRAGRAGWRIAEIPIRVIYPPRNERRSHFRSVVDPTRIVFRLLLTTAEALLRRPKALGRSPSDFADDARDP